MLAGLVSSSNLTATTFVSAWRHLFSPPFAAAAAPVQQHQPDVVSGHNSADAPTRGLDIS